MAKIRRAMAKIRRALAQDRRGGVGWGRMDSS